MELDDDIVMKQYMTNLSENLKRFTEQINERLSSVTEDLNICQANLTILEKKIASISEKTS